MEKIRIGNQNIKRIEVNDNGEYIELNFNDRSFPARFYELAKKFDEYKNEFEKRYADIEKEADEVDELGLSVKLRKKYELDLEIHEKIKDEVDKLFGADTCRKVFGDITPNLECYVDLFTQLTPFIEEYAKKQAESAKYNPNRMGNA